MTTVDWIILLVIIVYTLLGLRKGFAATIVSAVGSLCALILALFAASRFKEPIGAFLAPHLSGSVQKAIPEIEAYADSASELWDSLSGYLQHILAAHGTSFEQLEAAEVPGEALVKTLSEAVGEEIAYIAVLILAFIALRVAVHFLLIALDAVTGLPVIHSANALLGGVVGFGTGLVLCTVVLWAIKLVVPSAYSDAGMLSPSVMSHSSIASRLVGWNDGVSLFEDIPVQDGT